MGTSICHGTFHWLSPPLLVPAPGSQLLANNILNNYDLYCLGGSITTFCFNAKPPQHSTLHTPLTVHI